MRGVNDLEVGSVGDKFWRDADVMLVAPDNKNALMIITDKGQVIRTKISGISLLGRNTQGVRLINVKPDEKVVAVEKIAESEEDTTDGDSTETPVQ